MKRLLVVFFLLSLMIGIASASTLRFPNGLKEIEEQAFYGDTSLDEVILPNGIVSVGNQAFANSSISKITFPDSLRILPNDAFQNTQLTTVVAEMNTVGYKWAVANNISVESSSGSTDYDSVPTVTSARGSSETGETDVTQYLGQWFIDHNVVGGGFRFVATKGGSYSFSVKTDTITNPFRIRIYADRNGERKEIKQFKCSKSNIITTYVLDNVVAGETIYWWEAQEEKLGWTYLEDYYLKISEVADYTAATSGGKVTYNGHTYQLFEDSVTWEMAKSNCESLGGHLLTITSAGEQNFIIQQINTRPSPLERYWIGATDSESEGTWKWITGEKWNYTNWSIYNPENNKKKNHANICGVYKNYTSINWEFNVGEWDDEASSGLRGYICEWGIDQAVQPTAISLSETYTCINIGSTYNLSYYLSPENASDSGITWTSSNTSVATVANGKVTGVSVGTATITVKTANGKTATCEVYVEPVYPTSITLNKHELELTEGAVYTFTAALAPSNVSSEAKTITWSSSNTSVATVTSAGKITAKKAGSVIITAETVNGMKDHSTVTVIEESELTGAFEQDTVKMPIRSKDIIGFHTVASSGSIASVSLKNKTTNKTIKTISYNGENKVSGQFELDATSGGAFTSRGKYTVALIAEGNDGEIYELDTAEVKVVTTYPRLVTGVEATYTSSGIEVTWDNNEDATRYCVLYDTVDDYLNNSASNADTIFEEDIEADEALIPASKLEYGQTYILRVTSYNKDWMIYSPDGPWVYVVAVKGDTPCVSARFDGDQNVYKPGEKIYIDIDYKNIVKVHYINGDTNYNANSFESDSKNSGDIWNNGTEYTSNRSGSRQVTLYAQQTPGKYHVQIWAKNKAGSQATASYNAGSYLELVYWVRNDRPDAPTLYEPDVDNDNGTIELSWSQVSGATGYRILYGTEEDPKIAKEISGLTSRSVSDEPMLISRGIESAVIGNLPIGILLRFWVQAQNAYGLGEISEAESATIESTSPSISASFVNGKTSYNPGENIQVKVTYRNVKKVHYTNGGVEYSHYAYEGSQNADDIGSNESSNQSGTKTISLPAQSTPGKYHVQLWAVDKAGNKPTPIDLAYTVSGTVPSPTVSMSINSDNSNEVLQGCDKRHIIYLTTNCSRADKLVYTLYQGSSTNTKTFTTPWYFDQNEKAKSSVTFEGPDEGIAYSDSQLTHSMSFIPSDSLEPGTYTLRVTATNANTGSVAKTAEVSITISNKKQKLLEEMRKRAEAAVSYEWIPSQNIKVWNGNTYNGKATFIKGEPVKGIPYTLFTANGGQDTLAEYKKHALTNYTKSGYVDGYGDRTGPAYGTCCATFVCEIFGGSFVNQDGHPKGYNVGTVMSIGDTSEDVEAYLFEEGDAISCYYDKDGKKIYPHVIWISEINGSEATIYECSASDGVCMSHTITLPQQGYLKYGSYYYKTVTKSPDFD